MFLLLGIMLHFIITIASSLILISFSYQDELTHLSYSDVGKFLTWVCLFCSVFMSFYGFMHIHILCTSNQGFHNFSIAYGALFLIRFVINALILGQDFTMKFNLVESVTDVRFGMLLLVSGLLEILLIAYILIIA